MMMEIGNVKYDTLLGPAPDRSPSTLLVLARENENGKWLVRLTSLHQSGYNKTVIMIA
jgi:hypothetical protein